MAAEVGSVYVALRADARQANVAFDASARRVTKWDRDTGRHFQRFERNSTRAMDTAARSTMALNRAFGFAKAGLAGMVAGLSAGALTRAIGDVVSKTADLGALAKTAGVTAESFQELSYAATQSRIGTDQLADGLKELALRGDEWIETGGGAGEESFRRLGYTADELARKLKNPADLFQEIIGRIGELDKAAQLRVADELFGGSAGEQFLRIVDQGEAGIQAMRDRSRELGLVLSNEAVAGAEKVAKEFDELMARVDAWWKTTVLDIVGFVSDGRNWRMAGPEERLGNDLRAPDQPILNPDGSVTFASPVGRGALADDVEDMFGVRMESGQGATPAAKPRYDWVGGMPSWAEFTDTFNVETGKGSGGGRSTKPIKEQRNAVEKLLESLADERAMLTMSAGDQDVLTRLRSAGVDATSAQGQQIAAAVHALHNERDAIAALQEQMQVAEGLARDFGGSLISDPQNGVTVAEALGNAFSKLGQQLLQMASDAAIKGLFSNLLGGAFGGGIGGAHGGWSIPTNFVPGGFFPGFDGGGYTGAGGRKDVAGLVHRNEVVWSAPDVSRAGGVAAVERLRTSGGDGGGGIIFAPVTHIDASGSNMSEAQFKAILDQRDRRWREQFPSLVRKVQANPRKGYV